MKYNHSLRLWEKIFGNEQIGHISSCESLKLASTQPEFKFDKNNIPTKIFRLDSFKSVGSPKHISSYKNNLVVCNFKSKSFVILNRNLKVEKIFKFNGNCIECLISHNYAYISISDLKKPSKVNKLAIVNLKQKKLVSQINTQGQWSKAIAAYGDIVLISNWLSNNISVINIKDKENPKFLYTFQAGVSPRGMAFNKKGELLVAGYYSRNIMHFKVINKVFTLKWLGEPFDYPNYSGNMRSIIINGNIAYITNMGRNLLLKYSISRKKFIDKILLDNFPSGLIQSGNKLFVICTKGNVILEVDKKKFTLTGKSEHTGLESYSLCKYGDKLATASFGSGLCEIWTLKKHKEQTNTKQNEKSM